MHLIFFRYLHTIHNILNIYIPCVPAPHARLTLSHDRSEGAPQPRRNDHRAKEDRMYDRKRTEYSADDEKKGWREVV